MVTTHSFLSLNTARFQGRKCLEKQVFSAALLAASSNAMNPLEASGANSPSFLNFVRLFISCIAISFDGNFLPADHACVTGDLHRPKGNVPCAGRAHSALEVHSPGALVVNSTRRDSV